MLIKDKKRRLFFALWPSAQVRQAIVDVSGLILDEMSGRKILPQNYHITLHFIGPVTDGVRDCLHQSVQSISFEPFDISLDCVGFFCNARIFWMGVQTLPDELSMLHKNLTVALSTCDCQSDLRPYSPHVSLLRKAEKCDINHRAFSINWHVDEFVLVESVQQDAGVRYRVIERYSMRY